MTARIILPKKLLLSRTPGCCPSHGTERVALLALDPTVYYSVAGLVAAGLLLPDEVLATEEGVDKRSLRTAFGLLIHAIACLCEANALQAGSGRCVHLLIPAAKENWSGAGARECFNVPSTYLWTTGDDFTKALKLLTTGPAALLTIRKGNGLSHHQTEAWLLPGRLEGFLRVLAKLPPSALVFSRPKGIKIHKTPAAADLILVRQVGDETKQNLTNIYQGVGRNARQIEQIKSHVKLFNAHLAKWTITFAKSATEMTCHKESRDNPILTTNTNHPLSNSLSTTAPSSIRRDEESNTSNSLTLSPEIIRLRRYLYWDAKRGSQAFPARFYGLFQSLTSEERQTIRINGSETVELDYANCQPRLALHLAGFEREEADLYRYTANRIAQALIVEKGVSDIDKDILVNKVLREPVKKAFMRVLFSKAEDRVEAALSGFEKTFEENSDGADFEEEYINGDKRQFVRINGKARKSGEHRALMDSVNEPSLEHEGESYHWLLDSTRNIILKDLAPILENRRNQNTLPLWVQLQATESKVMAEILSKAVDSDIPLLPIHDGLIVRLSDALQVRQWMLDIYFQQVGFMPVVHSSKLLPQEMPSRRA